MSKLLRQKSSVTVQPEKDEIGLCVLLSLMHLIHLIDHQLRVTHNDQTVHSTSQGSFQPVDESDVFRYYSSQLHIR